MRHLTQRSWALILISTLVLAGCDSLPRIPNPFASSDDKEVDDTEPKALSSIDAEIRLETRWDHKVGKGSEDKAIRLVPGLAASRIFAASANGYVVALQKGDGREIWRVQVTELYPEEEQRNAFGKKVDIITGGVGVGGDLVSVGTAAGEVVVLNQSDGSLRWKARTTSEILAPPQIGRDHIVVQTIDGKVAAYDILDGTRRWIYSTTTPSLTLRGTSTPLVMPEFVAAAFANGRFVLLDPAQGLAGVDQRVAVAQGRSDLERLTDVDGAMAIEGAHLFVAGYQGSLAAYNINNGRFEWMNEASSIVGVGVGFGNVYLAHANSKLSAYDVDSGKSVWDNEDLLNRDITTPVRSGSYLVVGDYDGYLHVVAQSDGRFVGRRRIDGDGLYSPVVADGNRLYVLGNSGRLSVLEIQ